MPTPQSDRRRTLCSHPHTQAPINEESEEIDTTQYMKATEEIMKSSANSEADHESDDDILSS
ncbi:uncharacterized protein BDCG_16963 [Blastomyces dermatitidis ER-3]|uniref:Uncharacterized protein n=1 Tax=Ajellomyces dermatitidis (strain ER-3 / ATCC MYA-2586) TaxID=559297 RepID=A0ABX2VVL4_AJEDR|nr:uncharacterized protein BDCG_16963 [Blastomyces dermatitidis ER-3]OAT01198.1 hypothetical protein BDCG_16963 [Blastomyces dermatitidis ER-3]